MNKTEVEQTQNPQENKEMVNDKDKNVQEQDDGFEDNFKLKFLEWKQKSLEFISISAECVKIALDFCRMKFFSFFSAILQLASTFLSNGAIKNTIIVLIIAKLCMLEIKIQNQSKIIDQLGNFTKCQQKTTPLTPDERVQCFDRYQSFMWDQSYKLTKLDMIKGIDGHKHYFEWPQKLSDIQKSQPHLIPQIKEIKLQADIIADIIAFKKIQFEFNNDMTSPQISNIEENTEYQQTHKIPPNQDIKQIKIKIQSGFVTRLDFTTQQGTQTGEEFNPSGEWHTFDIPEGSTLVVFHGYHNGYEITALGFILLSEK